MSLLMFIFLFKKCLFPSLLSLFLFLFPFSFLFFLPFLSFFSSFSLFLPFSHSLSFLFPLFLFLSPSFPTRVCLPFLIFSGASCPLAPLATPLEIATCCPIKSRRFTLIIIILLSHWGLKFKFIFCMLVYLFLRTFSK